MQTTHTYTRWNTSISSGTLKERGCTVRGTLKPYFLLQSFRFGAEIAYVGATILHVGKNVRKILVGGKQNGKTAVFHHFKCFSSLKYKPQAGTLCKM